MKISHTAAILTLAIAALSLPLAAQTNHPSQTWYLRDGSHVEGSFVKLLGDKLLLKGKEKGKEKDVSIPRDWLTPASMELANAIEKGMSEKFINTILAMDFFKVSAGPPFTARTFDMGAPKENVAQQEYEPSHRVEISRDFYLKTTEVTWSEWNAVREFRMEYGETGYSDLSIGRNGYKGDESGSHPVTEVTWWDAVKWCNLLSQIRNKTPVYYMAPQFNINTVLRTGTPSKVHVKPDADGYRLPTEAEWELSWHCGGWAKGIEKTDCWNFDNSEGNTHPVRTRPSATAYRLHDLLGNVAEWCWDWKGPLGTARVTDPPGPETGVHHVFRGGSWADVPRCCTPVYRGDFSPITPSSCFIGFRPAHNIPK